MINYFTVKNENKTWIEITREERFFCSELYHDIKKDIKGFIKFLNKNCNVNLNEHSYWEIGYEVCFYRDYIKAKGNSIKKFNRDKQTKYPPKRTFDLCLFSNEKIVIIEAKADQKFKGTQLEYLRKDIEDFIPNILMPYHTDIKTDSILLCSSGKRQNIKDMEGRMIFWDQLYEHYRNKNYKRADELGKNKRAKK